MPEHVLIDKPVGVVLDVYEYDIESIYTTIRECATSLKDDKEYYNTYNTRWSCECNLIGMFTRGYKYAYVGNERNDKSVTVQFRHSAGEFPSYWHRNEVVMYLLNKEDIPCTLHYKVAYAVVSKEKGPVYGHNKITIAFYNKNDEMVITLRQYHEQRWGEIRSKAGKYILDEEVLKEKIKKGVAGGCFFCDNASYVKDNGIIYIACNKYDGRVAEVEYTGEAYPEYCRRRI